MLQIFIILKEISSIPCALFIFNALIILRILTYLKSKDFSLAWVKNIWFTGSTLPFLRGIHCSAKNLLKIFAFVWISVTNLSSIKRGIYKFYNPISKRCNLCLTTKLETLDDPDKNLLNERSEIISQCCHKNKYRFKPFF